MMRRAWLFAGVISCAGAGLFLACTSFNGHDDSGNDATDASSSDATEPEGDGTTAAPPDGSPLADAGAVVDSAPVNLVGPFQPNGFGACDGWTTYRATTSYYAIGDGGACIMCFAPADAGNGVTDSYVDHYTKPTASLAGGAIYQGNVVFQAVPPDAGPSAGEMHLNLFGLPPDAAAPTTTGYGGAVMTSASGAPTQTQLEIDPDAAAVGISRLTFRIDGDHSPSACVLVRDAVFVRQQ